MVIISTVQITPDWMYNKPYVIRTNRERKHLYKEDIIREYIQLLAKGDVFHLLGLFSDDAIIYEPFSKKGEMHGKSEIESFLQVATAAVKGMKSSIAVDKNSTPNRIRALCTFRKGSKIKMMLVMEFSSENEDYDKIKTLHICVV